jgi:hypothetical protein
MEALCGRLSQAAELGWQAAGARIGDDANADECSSRAAMDALAYVHVKRNELPEARRWLRRADQALHPYPDQFAGAVAHLVAARGFLAQGRAAPALELVARARHGRPPAPWLGRSLSLTEAQARIAEGNVAAAINAARRAGAGSSVEATAILAHACLAAGDIEAARNGLTGIAAAAERAPDYVRLQAWLADAHLAHETGDRAQSVQSLEHALRLADGDQWRLPFAVERAWMPSALRHCPDLALSFRHLLKPPLLIRDAPARSAITPPAIPGAAAPRLAAPAQPERLIVEKLSVREGEVLEHASQLLGTTEIAAGNIRLGQHGQESSEEHLPEAGRGQQKRSRPAGAPARADLTRPACRVKTTRHG